MASLAQRANAIQCCAAALLAIERGLSDRRARLSATTSAYGTDGLPFNQLLLRCDRSQEDPRARYDSVVAERDALQRAVSALQQELSGASAARTTSEVYKGALSK